MGALKRQSSDDYLAALQANGLPTEQTYGVVERVINAQSFMLATNDFFLYCAVTFFTLSGLVWLTKPQKMDALGMQNAPGH
jgi:DHA2 family multidrug resistance protein